MHESLRIKSRRCPPRAQRTLQFCRRGATAAAIFAACAGPWAGAHANSDPLVGVVSEPGGAGLGVSHRSEIFGTAQLLGNVSGGSNYIYSYLEWEM